MKKYFLFVMLIILININPCYAGTKSFMETALNSWLGYNVNDIINYWGYPTAEKSVAGRKLYVWQTSNSIYIPQNSHSNVSSYGYGYANVNTQTYGGYSINTYCNKTIEVDKNNKIINWEWEGNDCPGTYIRGKKLVNPQNDIWQIKKAAKQREKQLEKEKNSKNKQNNILIKIKNFKLKK